MGQVMFSGAVEHSPHVEPSPSGSAGGGGMNQGSSHEGVTTSHGQLALAPSFTVNQAPPIDTVACGATEGFTPESTQRQPCMPQPGPQVRNDVHS